MQTLIKKPVEVKKSSKKPLFTILAVISLIIAVMVFFVINVFLNKNVDTENLNLNDLIKNSDYTALLNAYNSNNISDDIKLEIKALLTHSLQSKTVSFFNSAANNDLTALLKACKKIPDIYINNKVIVDNSNNLSKYKQSYKSAKDSYENKNYIESLKTAAAIPDDFIIGIKNTYPQMQSLKSDIYAACIGFARGLYSQGNYEESRQFAYKILNILPNDPGAENIIFSTTDLAQYDGVIEHIFFHPLIAFTSRAFGPAPNQIGQDNYMATVYEFKQTLQQLYKNDYVLIDINSMAETKLNQNGGVESVAFKKLMLPKGKKPVILSIDDMNYYEYMKKDGQVFKLILDDQNNVATYSITPENQELISRDNETVPILDIFANEHTDFCINGAKGCIALTGYEGILGYNTDEPNADNYNDELTAAKAVVKRLKETGWVFASHSQGHRQTANISFELLKDDTDRWAREVQSIIGPTNVYIYPFGQQIPPSDQKFKYLQSSGFSIFCGVSSIPNLKVGGSYIIQTRRNIDGIALRDKRLYDMFDVPSLVDPLRPWYDEWVKTRWN